jgi:hypothetical protein
LRALSKKPVLSIAITPFIRHNYLEELFRVSLNVYRVKGDMSYEDRRTYERFQVEVPLDCSEENSREEHSLCARDISAEGLGVISEKKFRTGTVVHMSLHLPGLNKELTAEGEVIWSEKSGDGFRVGINLGQEGLMEVSTILRFLRAKPS